MENTAEMNLARHFLVAMPNLTDPIFSRSLILICEHNAAGAMGVMLNRPLGMTVEALFEQLDLELHRPDVRDLTVYFGGPVQTERGFILHSPLESWQASLAVGDELGLTTSRDILNAVSEGSGPAQMFVALGFTGWEAGQLEKEIAENSWLTVPMSDMRILFDVPSEGRYDAALALLGIDAAMLSKDAGHA
ncbi:YqgE/AlgH family protein [Chitinibacter sp. S2-10]|uniref:YqgE/AlgH family protein n=1 Tax=Chitinibacter sp. S2-10 TaxID=3373597 RepID=UPI003977A46D